MTEINPPVSLDNPENQSLTTYMLTTAQQLNFDYPPEFFVNAKKLWSDPGVKKCFERSNEYQLIDSAQ